MDPPSMPFRAFVSADFGALPKVAVFAGALQDSGGQLKLVDLDLLHTTLKFLGDTDEKRNRERGGSRCAHGGDGAGHRRVSRRDAD